MTRLILISLLTLLVLPITVLAATDWGPWETPRERTVPQLDSSPFDQAVHFFQSYISPIDGPRCPMYPTCSAYSRQALAKHGPWIGAMLTVDRLIHENDPREKQQPVRVGGRMRYADPVSNNDFWLTDH